jgi:hypothetical protein
MVLQKLFYLLRIIWISWRDFPLVSGSSKYMKAPEQAVSTANIQKV